MIRLLYLVSILAGLYAFAGPPRSIDVQHSEVKNLLKNPGFEYGKSDWTASAGTFTITTTASNVGQGVRAASWDGSATGQTLTSGSYTLTAGYYGNNCLAKVLYKTAESTVPYVLEALDGSNNVLASQTLNAASNFTRAEASFICPSSGSVKLRVRTSSTAGDPAVIYVDGAFIGLNYLVTNVSQAQFVGSAYFAQTASCTWAVTSASLTAFATTAACPGPTVEASNIGTWSTTDTDLPKITVQNLPPGVYAVRATLHAGAASSSNDSFAINDGSTTSQPSSWTYNATASVNGFVAVSGTFTYTTSGSHTFSIYGAASTGSVSIFNRSGEGPLRFEIYRFPSSTEQAISLDQAGWRIDANISGASPSLGTSNVSSYTGIESGSLTLTQNSGSATAWIPCSSTNDSSGTTCSVGNESVGVSFTIPYAGDYLACASFGWNGYVGDGASPGLVAADFQVVETPNAAQTISQEGKSRVEARVEGVAPTTLRHSAAMPVRVCGNFTFSSVGRKTLRLMYEQSVSAVVNSSAVLADAASSNGQRDIHWEVYPISRAWPLPLIVGGVSSNTSGQERIERARLNCAGSSSIQAQSGTWIASIGNISSGTCALTFTAGIFASAPTCVTTAEDSSSFNCIPTGAPTTSGVSVRCFNTTTNANPGSDGFAIICMGPK